MRAGYALLVALLLFRGINAEERSCDIMAWKASIDEDCKSYDTQITQEGVLEAAVCAFSAEFKQNLRVVAPERLFNVTLQAGPFDNIPTSVQVFVTPYDNSLNASEEVKRDIVSYYDGYIVEAEALPDFAQYGLVLPLDQAIISGPELNWFRINRYYRGLAASHLGRAYGVPLSGAGVYVYYRQDLFELFNMSMPATWDEMLALALAWDANPLKVGISPFCMSLSPSFARTLLLSIAAPLMQATGMRAGFLIDPSNGTILLNSTGFTTALHLWQQLNNLSANTNRNSSVDPFAEGLCLMTVQQFESFKVYTSNTSLVNGKVGVSPPLGSQNIMNRGTGALERCNRASCPYSVLFSPQKDAFILNGSDGSEAFSSSSRYVNFAPFMRGGLVGMLSARNPNWIQSELLTFFAELTSNHSLGRVLKIGSNIAPFRADQWSLAAKQNWTAAGYDESAVEQMFEALRLIHTCPNLAPQLRLPGHEDVKNALSAALENLRAGQSPATVATALQAEVTAALLARYGMVNGTYGFLWLYRQQVGYVDSPSTSVQALSKRSSITMSRQTLVVIVVVIGLALLLSAVVVLEVRNKRRHKDLLGRVKPPLGDPDTTIVVVAIKDFDELWEALVSEASERALKQFSDLVDALLRRYSGYRAPCDEEEVMVAAFHCPRDACGFALQLQRGLMELRWPKHVLELEQFSPQYLTQSKRAVSFNQNCTGGRTPMSPIPGNIHAEDDDNLFALDTSVENVRSFGEQCVTSWSPADVTTPDSELVFCGIRACVGLCAVGFSQLSLCEEPHGASVRRRRFIFVGEAVSVAAAAAAAAQGGMVLIPQSTFRQLHLEMLAEQCLFCHLGEYQLTAELPPMDLYLALDRHLLGRLALFGPLSCHMQWSQGAFAAPVHNASMVFTHVVGVQTLLAWDYDLMQDVIETFTRLAQVELQQAGGYLVEHVEGFMLTTFHSPADAILWGLRMQELMLKEDWKEELLSHELCEEVTVTVPVRNGEVTSATVFRGPRLKTGIDIGKVLARLHTMTGRMTYRGKVMNRAARISAAASSGQVLCSSEAWESCTTSASALRLVTATSLGLFQLKGIQERIEVFHCTYQRHAPSSTRRSSTVSMGLMSSSDNRRKSAVVQSSTSHISHHTTSYRTSLHNMVTLDHVSTLDITGGRRGSQASSNALLCRASNLDNGSNQPEGLHGATPDQVSGSAIEAAAAGTLGGGFVTSTRYRNALLPVLVGGDGGALASSETGQAGCVSQAGSSHRLQCSGAEGGASFAFTGAQSPRGPLASALQSRTRSASAIQPRSNSGMMPWRSGSTRSRRPLGLPDGAVASEPQVSLATAVADRSTPVVTRWNATTAMSPSASASLALAAAAAAVAAHERSQNQHQNIPKTNLPKVADSTLTHSNVNLNPMTAAGRGPSSAGSSTSYTAAVYAMLPSVVLSGNLVPQPGGPMMGDRQGHGQESRSIARGSDSAVGTSVAVSPKCYGSSHSAVDAVSAGSDLQMMATIATCVEGVLSPDDGIRSSAAVPVAAQSLLSSQQQEQFPPSFRFEGPVAADKAHEEKSLEERLYGGRVGGGGSGTDAGTFTGVDVDLHGMENNGGSQVETLEVSFSVTGIARDVLSGATSSNGIGGGALGSSCAVSLAHCGSATTGVSYVAMGASGGLVGSPGCTPAGGAGSHTSSCPSSGVGHISYSLGNLVTVQPHSAAMWRASVSPSPSPSLQGGLHGPAPGSAAPAFGRFSSANSGDLYLPFPLGAAGGISTAAGGDGVAGGPSRLTSNAVSLPIGISSDSSGVRTVSGGVQLETNSPQEEEEERQRQVFNDVVMSGASGVAAMPIFVPRRHVTAVHNARLTGIAAAAAAAEEAAPVSVMRPTGARKTSSRRLQGSVDPDPMRTPSAVEETSDPPAAPLVVEHAAAWEGGGQVAPTIHHVTEGRTPEPFTAHATGSGSTRAAFVVSPSVSRCKRSFKVEPIVENMNSLSHTRGRGSSSSGRLLQQSPLTGSGTSNGLASQALSPCSTWASGGSGSTTNITNTATISSIRDAGPVSTTATLGSGTSLEVPVLRALRFLPVKVEHLEGGLARGTLSALLGAGNVGIDNVAAGRTSEAPVSGPPRPCGSANMEDGAMSEVDSLPDSVAEPQRLPTAVSVSSHLSRDHAHLNDAAIAAAFGIAPSSMRSSNDGATAVESPPEVRGGGRDGSGNTSTVSVCGPSREQLEMAMELLGESRHAAGGGWR